MSNTPPESATNPPDEQRIVTSRQTMSVGSGRVDGTNVSHRIGLAVGAPLAIIFYVVVATLPNESHFGDLFLERGWVPYVLVLLAAWSVGLLSLKLRCLKTQRRTTALDVLPRSIADDITPDQVPPLLDHLNALPTAFQDSFLIRRVRLCLKHFQTRRSNPEVAGVNASQSEIDSTSIHSSYALLRMLIWAIPILGFIGTVLGISEAVSSFAFSLSSVEDISLLNTSLNNVTAGLGIAFDTTLIALVMSLIISFPASILQKAEEDLLTWVDEYCNDTLLKRLNDAGGVPDVALNTEAIAQSVGAAVSSNQHAVIEDLQALQQRMAEIQEQNGQIVTELAGAVRSQLDDMEERAAAFQGMLQSNFDAMAKPVSQALNATSETMTEMQEQHRRLVDEIALVGDSNDRATADVVRATTEAVTSHCNALAEGLRSLNAVLGEFEGRRVIIERRPLLRFPSLSRKKRD